jgi:1-deoxy-D-xylulose-5-phosphate reductoisomerase
MPFPTKRLCILGATGSIGENTLRVASDYPQYFQVVGLSANGSARRLAEQAAETGARHLCLVEERPIDAPPGTRVFHGEQGLVDLIDACQPDLVVVATVGYAGLAPTLYAIQLGITVALANKEVLVAAGELVMAAASRRNVAILPIDSEHNAIFQCLAGRFEWDASRVSSGEAPCPTRVRETPLRRLILTASGGPFRGKTRAELENVTVEQALAHPTWQMGPKITIDSATLMNKGFEVIETHHLFNTPPAQIEVIVHPQSVIHSLIEYQDGSMLAQLGVTDMYLPIANILAWPHRFENTRFEPLCLASLATLTFEAPDLKSFPCLRYAYDALAAGGTSGAVLNAANEVAVRRFLAGELRFTEIPDLIDLALQEHTLISSPDLPAIAAADAWTRARCEAWHPALLTNS